MGPNFRLWPTTCNPTLAGQRRGRTEEAKAEGVPSAFFLSLLPTTRGSLAAGELPRPEGRWTRRGVLPGHGLPHGLPEWPDSGVERRTSRGAGVTPDRPFG